MTAAFASALHPGDPIHIGPHDVWFGDHTRKPWHLDTPEADVQVDEPPIRVGHIVIIYWVTLAGRPCGAVVYEANDLIQLTGGAA